MHCLGEEVERLDAELAGLARAETALRLRLGQVLEVLSRGGCFELGFSSMGAYAVERCDRSARWADAACCLARRVEKLPELRRAMAFGRISWSMGEILARVAQPEDEVRWIQLAESRTVRQMRGLLAEGMSAAPNAVAGEGGGADDDGEACILTCAVDQEDAWLFEATRALLGQLGTHGGEAQSGMQSDAECEALLAEAQGTLLAALPRGALDPERWEGWDTAQRCWSRELGRWRAEAESRCEERIRDSVLRGSVFGEVLRQRAFGDDAFGDDVIGGEALGRGVFGDSVLRGAIRGRASEPVRGAVGAAVASGSASLERASCDELDGAVRGLSRALARHELELSRLVLRFHRADGWRRLGYATETQYARERLGISHSALLGRRSLALRLEKLPLVAQALGAGQIGVEAALQVARVATPSTQAAWVERARQRTVKHLREEVGAALVAVRWSGEGDCPPPAEEEMAAFHELERAVVSGRACQQQLAVPDGVDTAMVGSAIVDAAIVGGGVAGGADAGCAGIIGLEEPSSDQRRAWLVMLGSLNRWLESGLQMSAERRGAVGASAGRVTLRLRMSRSTYAWWRGLEAQARRWLPCGMSWVRFLCLSLWQAWRHLLSRGGKEGVAYGEVYIRDRYRCTSPVCSRRDVTPHHLRFRSAGGSDDPYNITSVCTWCHLCGVHGGRIRAEGTAQRIRWELGPAGAPCVVVEGRERMAA